MKKTVFLTLFLILFTYCSMFSLTTKTTTITVKNKEWKLFTNKDGIQIYFKYEECHDIKNGIHQEEVVLKLVNTTDKNIQISWDLEKWYNDNCKGCDTFDKENHFSIMINASETKIGSCETRYDFRELIIFSKFLNMENTSTLTKFNIKNITTTILN